MATNRKGFSQIDELRSKATSAFNKEKYLESIDYYTSELKLTPKNTCINKLRADVYMVCGLWTEAIADYEIALQGTPVVNQKRCQALHHKLSKCYLERSANAEVESSIPEDRYKALYHLEESKLEQEKGLFNLSLYNYLDMVFANTSSTKGGKPINTAGLWKVFGRIPSQTSITLLWVPLLFFVLGKKDKALRAVKRIFFNSDLEIKESSFGDCKYLLMILLDKHFTIQNAQSKLTKEDFFSLADLKENLISLIKKIKNSDLRKKLWWHVLSESTFLGHIFYIQRLVRPVSLKKGSLREIASALNSEENITIDPASWEFIQKDSQFQAQLTQYKGLFPRLFHFVTTKIQPEEKHDVNDHLGNLLVRGKLHRASEDLKRHVARRLKSLESLELQLKEKMPESSYQALLRKKILTIVENEDPNPEERIITDADLEVDTRTVGWDKKTEKDQDKKDSARIFKQSDFYKDKRLAEQAAEKTLKKSPHLRAF